MASTTKLYEMTVPWCESDGLIRFFDTLFERVTQLIRWGQGQDKESNWLPAPDGSFFAVIFMYWPKREVLDGTWKQPRLERVK